MLSFRPFCTLATLASLLVLIALPVQAQDNAPRKDILRGTKGERACDLETVLQHCNVTQAASPRELSERNISPVTPRLPTNLCTCNDVSFNIWSACTYQQGYNDLPVFADWLITCANSSVSLVKSQALSRQPGALGFEVPGWATIPIPGERYFDIQQAVIMVYEASIRPPSANSSGKWTTIQIILPIITAIASALIILLVFLFFRKRYSITSIQTNRRSSRGMVRLSSLSNLKTEAGSIHGAESVSH